MQMIRRLRVRRISPPMLDRKLKSKSNVAVLDLLDFELETEGDNTEAIPGAFRVDPSRLRNSPNIAMPDDVQVILYSSSGHDAVCARAAVGLNRIGIDNVWVLEGGLRAWREKGFPVSTSPEQPDVVAERLGVKLPAI
jgi:rhodanese-related sulfurtransferase